MIGWLNERMNGWMNEPKRKEPKVERWNEWQISRNLIRPDLVWVESAKVERTKDLRTTLNKIATKLIAFGKWVNEWMINVDLPWMAPRHQGRRCLCWRQRCRWERLPIRIHEDRFSEWETSADSEEISITMTSKTRMKRQSVVVVDVVVVVVVLDPRVVVLKRKPARWYRPLSLSSSHYLPFPWLLPPCLHLWTLPL